MSYIVSKRWKKAANKMTLASSLQTMNGIYMQIKQIIENQRPIINDHFHLKN